MIRNWNEFDKKLREVALLDLSFGEHVRVRDLAIVDSTTKFDSATKPILKVRENIATDLEAFYRAHRKEVEADGRRSIDMNFGRAGFRLGKPTLALLKGIKSWGAVVAKIKSTVTNWEPYIRVKEEVNKDALKTKTAEELASLGMKLKQEEEFFFETYPDKAAEAAA